MIIQDSDNPTLFDSQMGLTDVVYTIFTSGSTGEPKGLVYWNDLIVYLMC
jgi:D-alanine--poly(phosphoribitol) ligase subunit 1